MKSITVTHPEKAEIRILSYVPRSVDKGMKNVFLRHEGIDWAGIEKKMKKAQEQEDETKRIEILKTVSIVEATALEAFTEAVALNMIDRVVFDDGKILDKDRVQEFLDKMSSDEYAKLTTQVFLVVGEYRAEAQKKTI